MFSIVRGSQVLLKCHAAYGLEGAPLAFTAFYSLDIGKARVARCRRLPRRNPHIRIVFEWPEFRIQVPYVEKYR
jgi:hypothetical protein